MRIRSSERVKPFRSIVSRVYSRNTQIKGGRRGGRVTLELSCGHKVEVRASKAPKCGAHCDECGSYFHD